MNLEQVRGHQRYTKQGPYTCHNKEQLGFLGVNHSRSVVIILHETRFIDLIISKLT